MTTLIYGSGNTNAPALPLLRSVRTRASASAYFNRTPAAASNRQKWTWFGWIKRGTLSTTQVLFAAGTGASDRTMILFQPSDVLRFYSITGGVTQADVSTTAVLRDPASWYFVVCALDTTQATAVDRMKIYINGVLQAQSTTAAVTLNAQLYINNNVAHTIARESYTASNYFDGYFATTGFVDGLQLTPTSFSYTSQITGYPLPITYTGAWGTNGFYLTFNDISAATAAALGKDYSGNGNNWTPNNISVTAGVTYDSMTDVPTLTSANNANFATLNPLAANTSTTPTQGNLYLGNNATNNFACVATMGVSSGKWYWEVKPDSGFVQIGITSLSYLPANVTLSQVGSLSKAYYGANGQKYDNGTGSAYGATFSSADLMGIALDMDAGTLTFYKNNVSQGTAFTGLTGTYFPVIGCPNTYNAGYPNFGQRPFAYTPPSGFSTLNAFNLPASTVPNGALYMAATTYTGNGATQSISNAVNNVSFKPDFVWFKRRNTTASHVLVDSVRGNTKNLFSNLTDAEQTQTEYLTSFDSGGFSLGDNNPIGTGDNNVNTGTYVAWQWQAGQGTTSSNTSGSITSTVSVNPTAGVSVVTYTTPGGANPQTIGHGLGVAPKMIIIKSRNNVSGWNSYHASLGNTQQINLQSTAAATSTIDWWQNTSPTSSVWSIGANLNLSTWTWVAYCFAEIAGFSKFSSYVGTASADGPFIFTGFRPRWIMAKASSSTGSWIIYDTARSPNNITNLSLYANLVNAQATEASDGFDILSNGFKLRGAGTTTNATGVTFIYAAFAENPFKYALAR